MCLDRSTLSLDSWGAIVIESFIIVSLAIVSFFIESFFIVSATIAWSSVKVPLSDRITQPVNVFAIVLSIAIFLSIGMDLSCAVVRTVVATNAHTAPPICRTFIQRSFSDGSDSLRGAKYSLCACECSRQRIADRVGHAVEIVGGHCGHHERGQPPDRKPDHALALDRADVRHRRVTTVGHEDRHELAVIGQDDVRESASLKHADVPRDDREPTGESIGRRSDRREPPIHWIVSSRRFLE